VHTSLDTELHGIWQDVAKFSGTVILALIDNLYMENVCAVDYRYQWLIIGTLHGLSLAYRVLK